MHAISALQRAALTAVSVLAGFLPAGALSAQGGDRPYRSEDVVYRSEVDGTVLTGSLTLPAGAGPHPGVVVLSIAGPDPLVDRLARSGYAVLIPVRRGFVSVEPLLRATYQNLADDAYAAVTYLRGRPEVDGGALALLGQADDGPAAILAAAGPAAGLPLVLLAPPGFPGQEVFRLEQLALAERDRFRPEEVDLLEAHVGEIARIVLSESSQPLRVSQLQRLMLQARVRLPYNASFPSDEGQVHFLSSPLWRDRMSFDPVAALGRLRSPVLLLIGAEDADTPMAAYITNMRRGLEAADTPDWVVCRIEGRTRHTFSAVGVETIAGWLAERVGRVPETPPPAPRSCLAGP